MRLFRFRFHLLLLCRVGTLKYVLGPSISELQKSTLPLMVACHAADQWFFEPFSSGASGWRGIFPCLMQSNSCAFATFVQVDTFIDNSAYDAPAPLRKGGIFLHAYLYLARYRIFRHFAGSMRFSYLRWCVEHVCQAESIHDATDRRAFG